MIPRLRRLRPPGDRLLGFVIFAAAVAVLAWTWWSQHQDAAQAACLNRADRQLVRVINLRGQYSDADHAATVQLIFSVQTARTTAQFEHALTVYRDAENKITAGRKAHPLPVLSEVCGS